MKEVSCRWFQDKDEEREELASDIMSLETNSMFKNRESVFLRIDNHKTITILGKKRNTCDLGDKFELKSNISIEILIDLLNKELRDIEHLIDLVKDEDFCCENCKYSNNGFACKNDMNPDVCPNYYNDGKRTRFEFSDKAIEKILSRKEF